MAQKRHKHITIVLFALVLSLLLSVGFSNSATAATPGEYAFNIKLAPSFELKDSTNRFKVGGDFDYQLGYGIGFNIFTSVGFGSGDSLFQLMPGIRYDVLFLLPATLFVIGGAGYEAHEFDDQALAIRMGTGLELPLKKPWQFITNLDMFITANGVQGTPVTLDWFIGLGLRY